jgi:hypothetical protein
VTAILGFADIQRSRILGLFLAFPTLRRLFQSRAARLGTLFGVSCIFSTVISLYFLPIALIFSPLIFGLAHLWATFRYLPYAFKRNSRRVFQILASLGFLTSFLFIFVPGLYWNPVGAAALVIFGHNLIAYVYWYRAARARSERLTALLALFLALTISCLIATGMFDDALFKLPSNREFPSGIFTASQSLLRLLGLELSIHNTLRWLAIFAVTQNLHYFIWLKAIAEQNLPGENPTSFSRAVQKLRADYGTPMTAAAIASCVAIWLFALVNFELARLAYVFLASSHAYWELAALPFIFWTRS